MPAREVTIKEALAFEKAATALFKDEPTENEYKFTKQLVKTISQLDFWGARMWVWEVDGKAVSINATRFSEGPSRDAWGKYSSWYLAYTLPGHRRKGYATNLQIYIEHLAREAGMGRLRSLVGSWGGFRLHYRMGHDFWGLTDRGELVVDSPIDFSKEFPSGVPKRARAVCKTGKRLTKEELVKILQVPRFGRTEEEVREVLRDYPY